MLASAWVSNLGDGIAIAAGPLLVASQTDEAFLVALAALLQWLPPFIFGLFAGAIADRLDRRLIVVTVNLLRAVVLALLAASVLTDTVSIWLVLVAMFLLGTAEVFADNTLSTFLPMLVHRDDLGDRATPGCRSGSSRSTSSPGRRSAPRSSRSGMAWPFAAQAVLVRPGGAPARQGRAAAARPGRRRGADPDPARHRRGHPLDLAPPRGPHPDPDDPDVQRDLRRGLVGAGPLRDRAARARARSASA